MPEYVRVLLAFALAAVPAAVLCRLVMMLGVVDGPTEARKTQKIAVPTLGGLAIAAGAAISIALVTTLGGRPLTYTATIVSGGAVAGLVLGLADDIMHVPAIPRLVLMIAFTLAIAVLGVRAGDIEPWPGIVIDMPVVLAVLGSVLWLIVLINAVNFMDGANGLAMGMAAIAAAGLSAGASMISAWNIALLSGVLCGGLCGFLLWNVPGKIYAGDTGALFTGTALGALCLEFVRLRPDLLFVPPILLMPFLSDVLLTLAWRAKHGKNLAKPHRDHVYQIAMKAGLKHWQISAIHAFWALNAAGVALIAAIVGGQVPLIAFLIVLAIATWMHIWVRRVGEKAGLVGATIA